MGRKTAMGARKVTVDDLTAIRRGIYEQLVDEEQRAEFMKILPDIKLKSEKPVDKTLVESKINSIEQRVLLVTDLISALEQQRINLYESITQLQNGKNPKEFDLRKLLGPPAIEGAVLRYERNKTVEDSE